MNLGFTDEQRTELTIYWTDINITKQQKIIDDVILYTFQLLPENIQKPCLNYYKKYSHVRKY